MSEEAWEVTIPACVMKPVRKRKTKKLVTRSPFLNSNDNDHFRTVQPIKKYWRTKAAEVAREAKLPAFTGRIQIDAYVIKVSGQNYDPGNWYPTAKAIVDGLIDYGIAEDDNKDILDGPYLHHGGVGPNAMRLVIKSIPPKEGDTP